MLKLQTIQAKLAIGFIVGPLILAVVGGIAYWNTTALMDSLDRQRRSYQVLQQAEVVAKTLIDAQNGQRGYILTGLDEYLEPYTTATSGAAAAIAQLDELTTENPPQQARIERSKPLVNQRF